MRRHQRVCPPLLGCREMGYSFYKFQNSPLPFPFTFSDTCRRQAFAEAGDGASSDSLSLLVTTAAVLGALAFVFLGLAVGFRRIVTPGFIGQFCLGLSLATAIAVSSFKLHFTLSRPHLKHAPRPVPSSCA